LRCRRSANVSRGINSAINCYIELQKEAKTKARQTTLDKFLKPGPSTSTTAESDHDIILQLTDYSSSSSD